MVDLEGKQLPPNLSLASNPFFNLELPEKTKDLYIIMTKVLLPFIESFYALGTELCDVQILSHLILKPSLIGDWHYPIL